MDEDYLDSILPTLDREEERPTANTPLDSESDHPSGRVEWHFIVLTFLFICVMYQVQTMLGEDGF
jgi:hypothetical protein